MLYLIELQFFHMNKREFLKTGLIGGLGIASIPAFGRSRNNLFKVPKEFKLPELPYAFDALEPYFDKETMEIHYSKHHAGYTEKFNAALREAGIDAENARNIFMNASKYNAAIVNNGGGFFNHRLFWRSLSPNGGGEPTGNIAPLINRDFGSFENFRETFSQAARTLFGSGWTWLINQNGTLKIVTTTNQDNPFMNTLPAKKQGFPLLCLDVWDHAYYLKYQNRRTDYIDAFWNIVNWKTVNNKLKKSIES